MRRQPVDATKIRKVTRQPKIGILPSEIDTVESTTGYATVPTETPGFSVYNEYLAPGCLGPKVVHTKKTRVYRVLSGEGRLFKFPEEGEATIEKMSIGKSFTCEPDVPYQVTSSGQNHVEFLVIEDSKYTSRLTVLEKEFSTGNVELPVSMGVGPESFTVNKEQKRQYSKKTAQSQQAKAAKKVGFGASASPLPSSFVPEGLNAQPSMGNFAD